MSRRAHESRDAKATRDNAEEDDSQETTTKALRGAPTGVSTGRRDDPKGKSRRTAERMDVLARPSKLMPNGVRELYRKVSRRRRKATARPMWHRPERERPRDRTENPARTADGTEGRRASTDVRAWTRRQVGNDRQVEINQVSRNVCLHTKRSFDEAFGHASNNGRQTPPGSSRTDDGTNTSDLSRSLVCFWLIPAAQGSGGAFQASRLAPGGRSGMLPGPHGPLAQLASALV